MNQKVSNRTTTAISVTVSNRIKQLVDLVLTPTGFFEPPKGAYSQLVNSLFQDYLEKSLGVSIVDIYDFFEQNPEASLLDAQNFFNQQVTNASAS